jgi:hypothetical protein
VDRSRPVRKANRPVALIFFNKSMKNKAKTKQKKMSGLLNFKVLSQKVKTSKYQKKILQKMFKKLNKKD